MLSLNVHTLLFKGHLAWPHSKIIIKKKPWKLHLYRECFAAGVSQIGSFSRGKSIWWNGKPWSQETRASVLIDTLVTCCSVKCTLLGLQQLFLSREAAAKSSTFWLVRIRCGTLDVDIWRVTYRYNRCHIPYVYVGSPANTRDPPSPISERDAREKKSTWRLGWNFSSFCGMVWCNSLLYRSWAHWCVHCACKLKMTWWRAL